jgi:hypothetical protein
VASSLTLFDILMAPGSHGRASGFLLTQKGRINRTRARACPQTVSIGPGIEIESESGCINSWPLPRSQFPPPLVPPPIFISISQEEAPLPPHIQDKGDVEDSSAPPLLTMNKNKRKRKLSSLKKRIILV